MIVTGEPDNLYREPSRSALKAKDRRIQSRLEDLAKLLATLPQRALTALELDPMLEEAIVTYGKIPKGPGLARQLGFIAKLLRSHDPEDLLHRAELARGVTNEDGGRTQVLERWRVRLMDEGDAALAALLQEYPDADAQRLRQYTRAAIAERATGIADAESKSWRALFQVLRELPAKVTLADEEQA